MATMITTDDDDGVQCDADARMIIARKAGRNLLKPRLKMVANTNRLALCFFMNRHDEAHHQGPQDAQAMYPTRTVTRNRRW